MSDMADFALDCACDDCEEYDNFMSGHYSAQEAYERGLTNEFGGEDRGSKGWNTLFTRRSVTVNKPVLKCRVCGSTEVYWDTYPSGKYFIFDNNTKLPHVCNFTFNQEDGS